MLAHDTSVAAATMHYSALEGRSGNLGSILLGHQEWRNNGGYHAQQDGSEGNPGDNLGSARRIHGRKKLLDGTRGKRRQRACR